MPTPERAYSLLVVPAKELTEIQRFYADQLRDVLERIHQAGGYISVATEAPPFEGQNCTKPRDYIKIRVMPKVA